MATKNLTVLWPILVLSQVIFGVSSNVIMTMSCPYTWTAWGSHCYYFSVTYTSRSWNQAQLACEQQGTNDGVIGSNLASIHSVEEEHLVKNWFQFTADIIHIGLQQTAVGTNEYKWVDDTALDFINWGDNEPSYNTSSDLQCAYIERKVDKWHDMPCTGNLHSNHVCKGNTGTFTTTTAATTTAADATPAPPSLSGGQVFGIIIGVALGVGLVIVGVIMWRRYDVTSNIRSVWESYSGGGRSNMDSRSVDNVSVASVGVSQNQPDVTANRGSHFSNANYDIPQ